MARWWPHCWCLHAHGCVRASFDDGAAAGASTGRFDDGARGVSTLHGYGACVVTTSHGYGRDGNGEVLASLTVHACTWVRACLLRRGRRRGRQHGALRRRSLWCNNLACA